MWMWEGDPLANEMIKALGLSPYPLSVTDVLISLQAGLIDIVYGSPLADISLQWFTKIKFIMPRRCDETSMQNRSCPSSKQAQGNIRIYDFMKKFKNDILQYRKII